MRLAPFLFILLATFAVASCDTIPEEERFAAEHVAFTPMKNILVEDFTGQNCLNCPNAAEAVHDLQKLYGEEHVISVAIHGGELKLPIPYGNPMQLATEQGEEWNTHWKTEEWPTGMVDRTNGLQPFTAWSALAVERLQLAAPVNLNVFVANDDASVQNADSVTLEVQLEATASCEGKLCLWLVEDSITAPQRMPDGTMNTQYVHNHVFRTTLTPSLGDDITMAEGETRTLRYGITLPALWQREHLSPVVFLWNDADGVLQAATAPRGLLKNL